MFSDVVWKSGSPLVTAVTNVQSSKAAFFDGKLLLCGDAFTQLRPHLGLGCNLAALQATTLAKVLKGDMKMDDWERDIIGYATEFSYRSAAMGQFGLTGKFPDGYVPLSGSSVGQWATPPAT
jgi:2-polyprenyl-6-methoxyphenol hydroxylase-like FAD-dependent oxidoreductase